MPRRKRILLLTGGKYHPWVSCAGILKRTFEDTGRHGVTVSEDRDTLKKDAISRFDAVVVYTQGGELTAAQEKGMLDYVRAGGSFIGLHGAAASWTTNANYIDMLGGIFKEHGPVTEFPVAITDHDSVITRRLPGFRVTDELYILDKFDADKVQVLATAMWKGKQRPIAYTKSYGKGKVFYLALGHDERAFEHPLFQKMVVRGLDWTQGRKERPPLKAGVIGYGGAFNMGRLHLEGLRDAADFTPAAVCEIDPVRRRAAEEEQPGIKTFKSTADMLKKSDVEIVVIITPHNTHAKLAVQCAKAGRHVITEKPFCITVKEADAMIDAAKKSNVMLSVFHNRRWDGDYVTIRNLIQRGFLGEVFHIEASMGGYQHPRYWWRSDKKMSGGAFYDWGAHICDWVLGIAQSGMTEISGYFQQGRVWHDVTNEDHCVAAVRFANGTAATIELSSAAAVPKKRWRILGTLGALEAPDESTIHLVTHKDGLRVEGEVKPAESDWKAYYRNIGDHLLLGESLDVTPESARRVIALIETAEKSSKAGKALAPPRHCR
ncbi:MAG: ThuA domain-containing protein [Candidatus Hydrogenedentes bacterium]|nr:ThuA domain-containing protein [Candidatus Hydrogenedentota bacterium]